MADTPLFYRAIVPLNRDQHRPLKLRPDVKPWAFAAGSNMVPAVIEEFAVAARHLPVVFLPGPTQPTAVFLTGLQSGKNLMVDASGRWTGGYVPAYLRRYPFILGDVPGADPLICIDDTHPGFSSDEGEPLFEQDGQATQLLTDRIRLVNDFMASARRTEYLTKVLVELNLLRVVTVDVKQTNGQSISLNGLLAVDEGKLAALPDEAFLRLRREGLLGPIYAHLLALGSLDVLIEAAQRGQAEPVTRPEGQPLN
jgi:hypothetical protein